MIKSYKEFEKWVKIEMIRQELTQRKLAEKMGIAYPRISEALHGRKTGLAFIIPDVYKRQTGARGLCPPHGP